MNKKAQFYVFEAVIAVAMIFLAFLFVYTLALPPTTNPHAATQLKILADEVLYILKNTPAQENYIPAADACVGQWDFEEANGVIAYDTSGSDNRGKIHGARFTSASLHGKYALEFDGNDDYVNCGNDEELNLTMNFTLAAWINCKENRSGDLETNFFLSKGTSDNQYALGIYNGSGTSIPPPPGVGRNKPTLIWYDEYQGSNGQYLYFGGDTSLTNYTWYHIAASYDGDEVKIYLNSKLDKTYSGRTDVPHGSADDLLIGRWTDSFSWYFKGVIDDVHIWNRSLSWEEINATYNRGLHGSHENILTQWVLANDDRSRTEFAANMSRMLPSTVYFQVNISDGVSTHTWYPGEKQSLADTIVSSHYIISHGTKIYDVELKLWRI